MEKRVSVSIDQLKENRAIIVVYFILFLLLVVSALVSETFLAYRNITNVLRQAVAIGLVSLGQTFVILAAGLDLSVGSVISLTSCLELFQTPFLLMCC